MFSAVKSLFICSTIAIVSAVIFSVIIFSGNLACAQEVSIFPTGESEGLIGNTGLAERSSSSALIYNPASLRGLIGRRISANAGLIYQNEFLSKSSSTSGGFNTKDTSTLSPFVGTTWRFPNYSAAIAVSNPVGMRLIFEASPGTSSSFGDGKMKIDMSSSDLQFLSGLATDIGPKSLLGFSLGISTQNQYSTTTYFSATSDKLSALAIKTERTLRMISLISKVGYQIDLTENFSFGLRLSPPALLIEGSKDRKQENHIFIANTFTPSQTSEFSKFDRAFPWELGVGTKFKVSDSLGWLADLTARSESPTKNEDYRERGHVRGNTGFRYRTSPKRDLDFGLFYIPYSNNTEDSGKGRYTGATFGIQSHEERYSSGIGAYYMNSEISSATSTSTFNSYGLILTSSFALE